MDPGGKGDTLAAPFLGFTVEGALFGVTVLQSFQYFMRYPNDSLFCKAKVAAVCTLDLLHFIFSTHLMYTFLISDFGTEESPTSRIIWSLQALGATQCTLILLVQMIYLHRIYRLSRIPTLNGKMFPKLMSAAIGLVALGAIGLGILFCYELIIVRFGENMESVIYLGFGTTIFFDILIAAMMCFVLYKNRVDVGITHTTRHSDRLLWNLITYALATGLVTTFAAILGLILYLTHPTSLLYLSVVLSITSLYANSVLAMLNIRRRLDADFMGTRELKFPSGIAFDKSIPITSIRVQSGRAVSKDIDMSITHGLSQDPSRSTNSDSEADCDIEACSEQQRVGLYSPYYSPLEAKKQVNALLHMEELEGMSEEDRLGYWRAKKEMRFGFSISRRSTL